MFPNFSIVDGRYGPWSEYSGCSKSCGSGLMISYRLCNDPKPSGGGKDCSSGPRQERFKLCNLGSCAGMQLKPMTTQSRIHKNIGVYLVFMFTCSF